MARDTIFYFVSLCSFCSLFAPPQKKKKKAETHRWGFVVFLRHKTYSSEPRLAGARGRASSRGPFQLARRGGRPRSAAAAAVEPEALPHDAEAKSSPLLLVSSSSSSSPPHLHSRLHSRSRHGFSRSLSSSGSSEQEEVSPRSAGASPTLEGTQSCELSCSRMSLTHTTKS